MLDAHTTDALDAVLGPTDRPDDRNLETLDGLGAGWKVGPVAVPPPTSGVLCLLEAVRSPFVVGLADGQEITRKDVIEALYLCARREHAVGPVNAVLRARAALQAHAGSATSPDMLREVLQADVSAAALWGPFDEAVAAFGETLGVFTWEAVAADIHAYLRRCAVGYSMFPDATPDGDDAKKKTAKPGSRRAIWNGLQRAWSWCAGLCRPPRRTM